MKNKKYWKTLSELKNKNINKNLTEKENNKNKYIENFIFKKELFEKKTTRRNFLKWMGFGTASVILAACKGPVIHSIPYITKPNLITPGIPNYYASTMFDGFDFASVLIKTREGRPIKIESNNIAPYFYNTSARIQSSILSLYDNERLKKPFIKNKSVSWKILDEYVVKKLDNINKKGKDIIFLSHSLPSPSVKEILSIFSKKYNKTKLVIYDNYSYSYALDATEEILGIRALPHYKINKIELIVSFDADFLGDWSPESLEKDYAYIRKPSYNMVKHIQIESNMSITGSNADIRIPLKPSEIYKILIEVYKYINGYKTVSEISKKIGDEINKKGSKAVIFSDGSKEAYALSLLINKKIKSNALSNKKFILIKESNDKIFKNFIKDIKNNNNIGAILINDINILYSFYDSSELKEILKKIELTVSFSTNEDETTEVIKVLAPKSHWLESWGDAHPITGMYTLIQPTIQTIFNTRQLEDSLLIWSDFYKKNQILIKREINNEINYEDNNFIYYNFLKNLWEKKILFKSKTKSFNKALFNGFVNFDEKPLYNKNININHNLYIKEPKITFIKNNFELRIYTKISIGDGTQSNNPWLQELPDPITKATWGNYITMSPIDANKLNIKNWNIQNGAMNGDCVNIKIDNLIFKRIPVYIQPGQALGSIGISLGYGKKKGKVSIQSDGFNAYKFYKNFSIIQKNIFIEKSNKIHEFACTQLQNTLAGRPYIIKETDLKTFLNSPKKDWNKEEKIDIYKDIKNYNNLSLWDKKDESNGHHFNLSIDLNSCIGCNSCVISCHAENNVLVVGKDEIRKSRDMHWLRIDRYYSTEENISEKSNFQKNIFSELKMYKYLLKPEFNPQVVFQPIMCQHCNEAPCETVCPVAATSHSSQGQNMMTYNRCIGTRYCANNCPYKVRRFNWFNYIENKKFDYYANNDLGRMVLNPDVVIRSRGVMEKCSLCIQMTQATIIKAKREQRKIKDGEFETACTKSCPTKALSFGDINDKKSKIYKKLKDDRSYKLLDFIGTKPNVFYQVKIRHSKKI